MTVDHLASLKRLAAMVANLEADAMLSADELIGLEHDYLLRDWLNLQWDGLSNERVVAHLDCDSRHHQLLGLVNGGVWCTVVESLSSYGAAVRAARHDKAAVGVENITRFLRPHRSGRVNAVAQIVHADTDHQLWDVEITREWDAKPVAQGQVRLAHIEWTDPGAVVAPRQAAD